MSQSRLRSIHLLQTDSLELSSTANDWLAQLGGKSTQLVLRRFATPLDIVKMASASANRAQVRKTRSHLRRRFGSVLSPTQAAQRRRWNQAHARRRSGSGNTLPRLRHTRQKNCASSKKMRFGGKLRTKGETSGDFYKKRGLARRAMEEERQLALLSERRIRMEKKLEETIAAFRFMSGAYSKSMQVLESGGETRDSGRRTYPKLLAHMERNRLRTQKLMAQMTRGLEQARWEEQNFVNACVHRRRFYDGSEESQG